MPVEIVVPQLGESIVEATVLRWLKREGDAVAEGEPVVELETDKVNVDVPADRAGVLTEIRKQEGDTVGVGEALATMSEAVASQGEATPLASPTLGEGTSAPGVTSPEPAEAPAIPAPDYGK